MRKRPGELFYIEKSLRENKKNYTSKPTNNINEYGEYSSVQLGMDFKMKFSKVIDKNFI